ncbi:MAG: hypothetical protein U0232_26000 [Thermomicrobiales bacterium]
MRDWCVVGEFAAREEVVDGDEGVLGTVAHRQGDGAVEIDDRRGVELRQDIVEGDDLRQSVAAAVGAWAWTAASAACRL